jgi:(1->4)-alpha-D-glucan 1-alpha-D-glucosylmutase
VKLTVPGVPDIYQGGELWDFSLVDPDNRRPVDFALRQRLAEAVCGWGAELHRAADPSPHPHPPPLAGEGAIKAAFDNPPLLAGERGRRDSGGRVGAFDAAALMHQLRAEWQDGREKLFVAARLLGLRRDQPELFASGDYQPLDIGEGRNADRLCAFSRSHAGVALVVAVPRLVYGLFRDGEPGDWGTTGLALPSPGRWHNVFTGAAFDDGNRIAAAELFAEFPVAVLFANDAMGVS